MDRVDFIQSVQGIQYPGMIVSFFDHFIALKSIVEDSGTITVLNSVENQSIIFSIEFDRTDNKNMVMNAIKSSGRTINIYGRQLNLIVEPLSKKKIQISIY